MRIKSLVFGILMSMVVLCSLGATYINGIEAYQSINVSRLIGPVSVGASGGSSHSCTDSSDVVVLGKLEVDGTSYFDGGIIQYGNLTLQARLFTIAGDDVASAADITLGNLSNGGNYYDITGTTTIERIANLYWWPGSFVVLQFDGSLQVTHGVAAGGGFNGFQLAGGANFAATAGDTLMVVYDGAWWREVARTVI